MKKVGKEPRKFFIIAVSVFSMLCGCKSKQVYVERTDTVRAVSYVRDTLRIETLRTEYKERWDSIAPVVDSAGRVVAFDRWHYVNTSSADVREMERLRVLADSLRSSRVRVKTIPVEVVKTKEVNVLHWWQKSLIAAGLAALAFVGLRIIRKSGFS